MEPGGEQIRFPPGFFRLSHSNPFNPAAQAKYGAIIQRNHPTIDNYGVFDLRFFKKAT
jgi:hypothetical protein